ncbi:MAG: dihydropteroate synthase [Planctomycetota bacterium]
MVGVFGIVNVTRDSFSDGGRFLRPEDAIARARALHAAGADVIDLGAESTHPDAEDVPAATELERLLPVVAALRAEGVPLSVDTNKPEVMVAVARAGADWLNDVAGFRSDAAVAAAAGCTARLVVMFARNQAPRAERAAALAAADDPVAAAAAFFRGRIAALTAAGVARERIVLDPGMGFFLGPDPAHSFSMLRRLDELRALELPLLISVSRKSFLGAATGRGPGERGAATLAAELYAARRGVDWIRTHDVQALRDGLCIEAELARGAGPTGARENGPARS